MSREPVIYTAEPVVPAAVSRPAAGYVELRDEHDPIVYVQHPDNPNLSVAVRASSLRAPTPMPARDLTPQPLIDRTAQRMIGGGVGVGVAAWGGGQLLTGASQLVSAAAGAGSTVLGFALLLLAGKAVSAVRSRGNTYNITNNNKWGGKSTTRVK
jgi:hypothetical protein